MHRLSESVLTCVYPYIRLDDLAAWVATSQKFKTRIYSYVKLVRRLQLNGMSTEESNLGFGLLCRRAESLVELSFTEPQNSRVYYVKSHTDIARWCGRQTSIAELVQRNANTLENFEVTGSLVTFHTLLELRQCRRLTTLYASWFEYIPVTRFDAFLRLGGFETCWPALSRYISISARSSHTRVNRLLERIYGLQHIDATFNHHNESHAQIEHHATTLTSLELNMNVTETSHADDLRRLLHACTRLERLRLTIKQHDRPEETHEWTLPLAQDVFIRADMKLHIIAPCLHTLVLTVSTSADITIAVTNAPLLERARFTQYLEGGFAYDESDQEKLACAIQKGCGWRVKKFATRGIVIGHVVVGAMTRHWRSTLATLSVTCNVLAPATTRAVLLMPLLEDCRLHTLVNIDDDVDNADADGDDDDDDEKYTSTTRSSVADAKGGVGDLLGPKQLVCNSLTHPVNSPTETLTVVETATSYLQFLSIDTCSRLETILFPRVTRLEVKRAIVDTIHHFLSRFPTLTDLHIHLLISFPKSTLPLHSLSPPSSLLLPPPILPLSSLLPLPSLLPTHLYCIKSFRYDKGLDMAAEDSTIRALLSCMPTLETLQVRFRPGDNVLSFLHATKWTPLLPHLTAFVLDGNFDTQDYLDMIVLARRFSRLTQFLVDDPRLARYLHTFLTSRNQTALHNSFPLPLHSTPPISSA